MKRDMVLIRCVLECIEESDGAVDSIRAIKGYTMPQIEYHLRLCRQAGFVKDGLLTWRGHDELDKLRELLASKFSEVKP